MLGVCWSGHSCAPRVYALCLGTGGTAIFTALVPCLLRIRMSRRCRRRRRVGSDEASSLQPTRDRVVLFLVYLVYLEVKTPASLDILKNTIIDALNKIGYECPAKILKKLVAKATPSSSRNSSDAESQASSRASSRSSSPATSATSSGKRNASSRSDEETSSSSGSDSIVVGSGSGSDPENADNTFSLVKSKKNNNKKARLARRRKSDANDMETEQTPSAATNTAGPSPRSDSPRTEIQVPVDTNMVPAGLHINYSKAVRVADENIKILSPDVETFRRLNKYLINSKVQFHTYALKEERKHKIVIRGVPDNIPTNDIKNDLIGQGFPAHAVYHIHRRDGSSTGLVLVVLPKTEEARNAWRRIRVETPHERSSRVVSPLPKIRSR
ncbi:hypothetical protein EVAR_98651_1 [Eumeta japonica]|uniref:Nucleic-acid-binding protein from transposon X-element n=1 Tax=Eumeta variegata TaxID=151549 RepID=A0A4C1XZA1_EUMVA|nr:hypothetical protein EVAR_98651_1 [Eumeta japonica]